MLYFAAPKSWMHYGRLGTGKLNKLGSSNRRSMIPWTWTKKEMYAKDLLTQNYKHVLNAILTGLLYGGR